MLSYVGKRLVATGANQFSLVFSYYIKPCDRQLKSLRIGATTTGGPVFCSCIQFGFGHFFSPVNWTGKHYLHFIMMNQDTIHGEVYASLANAVATNVDVDTESLGQRTILPSFAGTIHHMQQLLPDALAINHYFKGGDLFLTMTANPTWPKIQNALEPGQTAADHLDLAVCSFHQKQRQLIKDIEDRIFEKALAYVFTIVFQKYGLPHMHCIIFLNQESKLHTPEQINSLLSSEFPDYSPELLKLVKKLMVHNPCGSENPEAPCMLNGRCTKNFSKPFRDQTTISEDAYVSTRCHDTGQTYQVRRKQIDNHWVITYSPYLIWKCHCHIIIESTASIKAVKYIYKPVREFGASSISSGTLLFPMLSDFRSTFLASSMLLGIRSSEQSADHAGYCPECCRM